MPLKNYHTVILVLTILGFVTPVGAEVTDAEVNASILAGSGFLKKHQKANGGWAGHPGQPGGMTALCTLALLNSGVESDSAEIQRALDCLRSMGDPAMVYSTALQTMVFCAATPNKDRLLISRNVQWLERVQIKNGNRRGAWKYSDRDGSGGDNSNTQFAMLALHEAERVGVKVKPETWKRALNYWLGVQHADGAWGYLDGPPATGSMTCAGIASVVIALGKISQGDARVSGDQVECCTAQLQHNAVERALHWLSARFSVTRNPNPFSGGAWLYYYLYGVERVGRLTGRRFIGRHDWFREGSEFLVRQQDRFSGYWRGERAAEQNALVATSFALLFLSKGRRPVVISKLKHGPDNDWDRHRAGVQHLTRRVEQRWRRDLSWQTIDVRAATVEDLLATPVLFLSGADALTLTPEHEENLRQYVNQGGFIFAEACCDGVGFDRAFRALMQRLFPDSRLRLLPPDHPVWYAETKVDPKYLRPLYGIDACCRTSVVYCPQDLSCRWELSRGGREDDIPPHVRDEIEACLRIGENVVTYATNRELKNKLDRPQVANHRGTDQTSRGVLNVAKLLHNGGGDDAPNSLPNMLGFLRSQAQMRVGVENRLITASDPAIFEYPLLYMHGRRAFRFSPAQRETIATYLQRGGMLFADAICASPEFSDSFRREIEAIFAGQSLKRIPPAHPLFSREYRGYELPTVSLRDPQVRREGEPLRSNLKQISPLLEGLEVDGRLVVLFSPYDISCALENSHSLECRGYIKEDAVRIAVNVILFALQQ